ncbi:MAG: response regulator transcription factor, partial [Rhodoferax sp.]
LTAVEFEVFCQIGTGRSVQDIAVQRTRSASTIESHRANIKRKLQLKSNAELTLQAGRWVSENR